MFGPNGDVARTFKELWSTEMRLAGINVRETFAAARAIRMALEHFQLRDTEIRIAIDNTCAEAWIRRGLRGLRLHPPGHRH